MKEWLQFTFLGFFSKKFSYKGRERKFVNVLLSYFLFALLFPLFLALGSINSFSFHLNNDSILKEAVNNIFANENTALRIPYHLENHKLSSELIINTFDNEGDAIYKYKDFNLIFDTRDQNTTYDDFTLSAKDKAGNEIAYTPKMIGDNNYSFEFYYSGKVLDVLAKQTDYENYLESISSIDSPNYNKFAKSDYDSLKAKKDSLPEQDYGNKIYELYVAYYYPNLIDLGCASAIPLLRGYYYSQFISQKISTNSIMVFDNMIIINYINSSKQNFVFDGYLSVTGGTITTDKDASVEVAKSNIHKLLNKTFQGGFALNFTVYFVNLFRLTPIPLLFVILFALIDFLIYRHKKIKGSFLDNCIIYASFFNIPSLLCSILGMILTILLMRGVSFSISIYLLFGLTLIRGILQLIFAIYTKSNNQETNIQAEVSIQ